MPIVTVAMRGATLDYGIPVISQRRNERQVLVRKIEWPASRVPGPVIEGTADLAARGHRLFAQAQPSIRFKGQSSLVRALYSARNLQQTWGIPLLRAISVSFRNT